MVNYLRGPKLPGLWDRAQVLSGAGTLSDIFQNYGQAQAPAYGQMQAPGAAVGPQVLLPGQEPRGWAEYQKYLQELQEKRRRPDWWLKGRNSMPPFQAQTWRKYRAQPSMPSFQAWRAQHPTPPPVQVPGRYLA